jgi:hypothetical protein
MIIFFLPALAIILLYLIDVGWARAPRGHEGKESQLRLPLDPCRVDSQARDADLHSRAS